MNSLVILVNNICLFPVSFYIGKWAQSPFLGLDSNPCVSSTTYSSIFFFSPTRLAPSHLLPELVSLSLLQLTWETASK